jgi:hypothetical protein
MTYSLMHGPALRQEFPYTFFLPPDARVDCVGVGDQVKLGFAYDAPGERYATERMWVTVTEFEDGAYAGDLDNEPFEKVMHLGQSVAFGREHILDIQLADETAAPALVSRREYWERCVVDACVIEDGIPVEYLYRDDDDLVDEGDEYADSGWRIRGRQGSDSDIAMDERRAAYVALGAVLNHDDSWLGLIDAPPGSAFMRDFATDRYEALK